jgi:hypothetical protein
MEKQYRIIKGKKDEKARGGVKMRGGKWGRGK